MFEPELNQCIGMLIWRYCQYIISAKFHQYILAIFDDKSPYDIVLHGLFGNRNCYLSLIK